MLPFSISANCWSGAAVFDQRLHQVTLRDVPESEDDSMVSYNSYNTNEHEEPTWAELLAEVESLLEKLAIIAPDIQRWWQEKASPAIESTKESVRSRVAKRKADRLARKSEIVPFVGIATEDSSTEIVSAPEDEGLCMSRDEAEQRLMMAVLAREFSDEQIRQLRSTRIEEIGDYLALKTSMERLAPEQIENHISQMLEGRPSFLDDYLDRFMMDQTGCAPGLAQRSVNHSEVLRQTGMER